MTVICAGRRKNVLWRVHDPSVDALMAENNAETGWACTVGKCPTERPPVPEPEQRIDYCPDSASGRWKVRIGPGVKKARTLEAAEEMSRQASSR